MRGRGALERLREPLTRRRIVRWRGAGRPEVWVAPMPGHRRVHAVLTARFGSLDVRLPDGTEVPEGAAHFLEHKMFQKSAGDVFDTYDERGASANAFTTFGHTSYLFSCTGLFEANLRTLLESLRSLEADEPGVRRERGIIGQEIAMYADDPSWRGYFNLLQALYVAHPARHDIAGSRQSIARLDLRLLRRIHATWYRPGNLVLVVAGDVDPGAVVALVEEACPRPAPGGRLRRPRPREPARVRSREVVSRLSVSRPHVHLGLKDAAPGGGARLARRRALTALALDLLFGDGGSIQAPLYAAGVVDDAFHASYEIDPTYAHAIVSAEVDEVGPYRARLQSALAAAARAGFTAREVERGRRRLLGRHLAMLNGPEGVAYWLLGAALDGTPLDAGLRALRSATPAVLGRRLGDLVTRPRAWSLLLPRRGR